MHATYKQYICIFTTQKQRPPPIQHKAVAKEPSASNALTTTPIWPSQEIEGTVVQM